ncbi:MAG TPA: hypothetical protein VN651_08150 [Gemmatimonadaceae bacterium]|nr:hypothetical protein [Gemmatimonadaceae bacterium]
MFRAPMVAKTPRSTPDLTDAADLRSVIVAALAAKPVDEDALRRGVWTLVGTERDAGASPGQVILALTELVDEARLSPEPVHQARLRGVILWCVEAYFGHLGGDPLDRNGGALTDSPRPSSNR